MPFPKTVNPSLCGYCLKPGRGFYLDYKNKYFAGCSVEHLEEIKLRLDRGLDLGICATSNPQAVEYAVKQSKSSYISNSLKNDSYKMHEWKAEDRLAFFNIFTAHYLTYESKIANEGTDGRD
tara:strand:+ start:1045 stop:1410 length:366 start_codon:yes stop_codon:yes gene_type:complete